MTTYYGSKTDQEVNRRTSRENNFYNQTVDQNNQRLAGKIPAGDVLDELKFIESQLLAWGPPGN